MIDHDEVEITPGKAWVQFWTWVPTLAVMAAIIIVLGGLVALIGWQVGGWFQNASTNRDARIQEHSFSYQQAQIDQFSQDVTNVSYAADPAAKAAWAGEACAVVQRIDRMPADAVSWVSRNCLAGSLSPSSPYFIGGK